MPYCGNEDRGNGHRFKLNITMEKKIERFRQQSRLRGESFGAFTHQILQILIILRHREKAETLSVASEGTNEKGCSPIN